MEETCFSGSIQPERGCALQRWALDPGFPRCESRVELALRLGVAPESSLSCSPPAWLWFAPLFAGEGRVSCFSLAMDEVSNNGRAG
jgi:hypothetical protein